MTDENRAILKRINDYAEQVMGDIDPQKVQVSAQIEKLKPILQEIADEKQMALEDMFILYMDIPVSYTHLRAHETRSQQVIRQDH